MNKLTRLPEADVIRSFLGTTSSPAAVCRYGGLVVDANTAMLALCRMDVLPEQCLLTELVSFPGEVSLAEIESRLADGKDRIELDLTAGQQEAREYTARFTSVETLDDLYMIDLDIQQPELPADPVLMEGLVRNSPSCILVLDENRDIVFANTAASELSGYSIEELCRLNLADLDLSYSGKSLNDFHNYRQTGTRHVLETTHVNKQGEPYPVEVAFSSGASAGRLYFYCYVRPLSEQESTARVTDELRHVLEKASDSIYLFEPSGEIRYANRAACKQLGYTPEELMHINLRDIDEKFSFVDNTAQNPDPEEDDRRIINTRHKRKDGSLIPVEVISSSCIFESRRAAVAFVHDLSEQEAVRQALIAGEERFRVIADTSPVALVICHRDTLKIQYVNKQALKLFARSRKTMLGININNLFDELLIDTQDSAKDKDLVIENREIKVPLEGGRVTWLSVNASSFSVNEEPVICMAMLDITEARELSSKLSYQASYDDLTGLYNRREFNRQLQEITDKSAQTGVESALCYLDLDQFKVVNDTCGHVAGDELLQQIGSILSTSVRSRDVLARLGGDEFAVLLENCSMENAARVAGNIRTNLENYRFFWEQKTFNITVSIGLVRISSEGESLTDLLKRADTACYMAKESGRNKVHVLHTDDEAHQQRQGEMLWVSRLNEALDKRGLVLYSQSIIPTVASGSEGGHLEVLVRMQAEDGSHTSPGLFLPVAEKYDLITRVDSWVTREVFDWLRENPGIQQAIDCCAINLSGQSLNNQDFLELLVQSMERSHIDPGKICFEITETAAIANINAATHFIQVLKERGCRFSLDDFGSGLSSFGYLKALPVDFVKIDGLFVRDVLNDPVDLAMVRSINEMAHALGKQTIAEFVESEEIREVMREIGVDYVQGYGVNKPSPLFEYGSESDS